MNARAEVGVDEDDLVLREVIGQKRWLLHRFTALCGEAGQAQPAERAKQLMLLLDGALVAVSMQTFGDPIRAARATAAVLLGAGPTRAPQPTA